MTRLPEIRVDREPDNVIVTDHQIRAISSKDPRIPVGAHYAPFLGPDNTKIIKAVIPHVTMKKPAFLQLKPYKIDSDTMVQGAEAYIIKNADEGYTCMLWRKNESTITQPTVWRDPMVVASSSNNSFTVNATTGNIIGCAYPDRAPSDPIGLSIWDTIHKEHHEEIKRAIAMVMENNKPYPIEYKYSLAGETRHKIGYISRVGSDVQFNVRRITQQELIKDNKRTG